ncbi:MAG: KEOPS complex N(6)-L-threonylcarbamoyladenine synthase Kae1 [Nitrososphaerota archaeon]
MGNSLVCLGIESTAHTIGFGIVTSGGEILSNELEIYRPRTGGIHPREAAQHHAYVAHEVFRRALQRAAISIENIDVIAFSIGPGLGPCLRTGATIARALALRLNRPLVAVNHGLAHIEIGKLVSKGSDPLVLYVAGGNTLVTAYHEGRYRIFGETLDIAAGNCLDAFGIFAGIGPMPSPEIAARKGKSLHPLPVKVKGMDVSFSGLLTAAKKLIRSGVPVEDVSLSITEAVYAMLVEVLERALALTLKKEVMTVGGLARSRRLREMIDEMVKLHDATQLYVKDEFLGDNGAMIAWTGILKYMHGLTIEVSESRVRPKLRIDEEEAPWADRKNS